MTTKKAIASHGATAEAAIHDELNQLVNKGVFQPIKKEDLTQVEKSRIIRSHMFVTEKVHPDGTFAKLKLQVNNVSAPSLMLLVRT
eukprot:gene13405-9599_t